MFEGINGEGRELRNTVAASFAAEGTGSLAEFEGQEGTCYGFIFKKTAYGLMTMLALNIEGKSLFVGIPSRYTDVFQHMSDDEVGALMKGVTVKGIKKIKTKAGKDTVVFNIAV